jgi:transcriptional regulator with XRE-family HTH domain
MLATRIGTSQPHLARMENGQGNVMRETMHRLCNALRVDMNTLDKAMQASAADA